MNKIKRSAVICVLAMTQLMLTPSAIATQYDDKNANAEAFSDAELAQILAPIALYPDSLLSHIVIASTYPLEVVQAYRWRQRNSKLDAAEAVERAENQGWDPSITALVAFPSVLERLNEDLQWTQNLGDAFLDDDGRVLDTIQVLREQAMQANAFDDMRNMRIVKHNRQIVIEPVQTEIVYVPYYDTRVIYGNWQWHRYPPVYWDYQPHLTLHFPGSVFGRFHFNSGVNISFNYHFSAFNWGSRHLVVSNHRKTRQYRSYSRIASSHGAKRWHHEPTHRRGVAYRADKAQLRNKSREQRKFYANNLRQPRPYNSGSRNVITSYKQKRDQGKHQNGLHRKNHTLHERNTDNRHLIKDRREPIKRHQIKQRQEAVQSHHIKQRREAVQSHHIKQGREPGKSQRQINSKHKAKRRVKRQ
jgi:hypothetical protein